jgi:hypothetical protein
MALPALRARLGLGLGRSYATGIAKVARGGSGGANYGKTMNTAARPVDDEGTRALVRYCCFLINVVGGICMVSYFVQLNRKVDNIQSNVDLLVKDQSRRNSTGL